MHNWKHAQRVALNLMLILFAWVVGQFLVASGRQADARSIPPNSASSACDMVAVTVTTDIMRDTLPGAAANRVIYFSNPGDSGLLTISVQAGEIPSRCYVWAGAAFSVSHATPLTSTPANPVVEFVYPYSSSHGPTVTVPLTSSANITGSTQPPHDLVALTFVRDPMPHKVWLPIVMRDYAPLTNGDFEQDWLGWTHGPGQFNGHGSGLPQSIVLTGTYRALLGDPQYDDPLQNYHIPVGYAYAAQKFSVPSGAPVLSVSFRVRSLDVSYGISTTRYFDTFEVSINTPPDQVTNSERDGTAHGCQSTALNPDNVTRNVTIDGLIACAGGPAGRQTGTMWDSDWRTVRLDLSAFAGQNITLYFANWNREYESPYYDDQGYFNTVTYIDNVQFVLAP